MTMYLGILIGLAAALLVDVLATLWFINKCRKNPMMAAVAVSRLRYLLRLPEPYQHEDEDDMDLDLDRAEMN